MYANAGPLLTLVSRDPDSDVGLALTPTPQQLGPAPL